MATTAREVEIKLDADDDLVIPDLSGIPGVDEVADDGTHRLHAVYFDTPDLRLLKARVVLRHRSGGADAGWHLKLPSQHGRLEVRRRGARPTTVPRALRDLIRVQVRDQALEPVARIVTERAVTRLVGPDATALAEVADDRVEAERLVGEPVARSWREVEVELIGDGPAAMLDDAADLLVRAGARRSTSVSKLASLFDPPQRAAATPSGWHRRAAAAPVLEYLRAQVESLLDHDPKARLGQDDGVHQMRVAARRLRSGLAAFRRLWHGSEPEEIRAELKWLGEALGGARDAEVVHTSLRALVDEQPPVLVLGPVRRRIDLEVRAEYRAAHAVAVEALDSERYLDLVESLEAFLAQPPLSKAGRGKDSAVLRRCVRTASRRVTREVAALDDAVGEAHDSQLHEIRKAAKRARYAGEAVESVVGTKATRLAKRMEQIQETLGDHHDAVMQRFWLRQLGVRAHLAAENGFTFGRLHGVVEARARHDEDEFGQIWRKADSAVQRWPGR